MTTITPNDYQNVFRGLLGCVLFLFAILILRLFYLQITTFADYARESDENRIAQKRIRAPRGLIYTRGEEVLARNRPFYTISLERSTRQEYESAVAALRSALGEVDIDARYSRRHRFVRLMRDVEFRTVSIVEERLKADWPRLYIEIETQRHYPYGSTAAHLLGYMGILQDENLPATPGKAYIPGDFIGRTGLEKVYEDSLRGRDGVRFIEVDADGRTRREFPERRQRAEPGGDLHLTIDLAVQQAAEQALPDSLSGSVVALDPRTGAVLALANRPTFDPNVFVSFQAQEERHSILQSETTLLNRAIRGRYPPGSTLKMIAAIAALEEGITDTLSTFAACTGALRVGDVVFHCLKRDGHGELNLQEAMEVSCNIYFHHLAQLLGIDTWRAYAERLGFGQPTGIDLEPAEVPGLLPSRAYYQEREGWSLGHLMNLIIGQGAILVTPMQMARYAAAIGNGGYLVTPHLCGDSPPRKRIEGVSRSTLEIVKKGMHRVIHGKRGTGRSARLEGIEAAGKSGTAQSPRDDDDAWFVAFAPYDDPAIAVAVVVEAGGSGGAVAGPIAREVMQAFFAGGSEHQLPSERLRSTAAPSLPEEAWVLR